jgi:hypothetical protein
MSMKLKIGGGRIGVDDGECQSESNGRGMLILPG